jgi:hypothetical protein
VAGINAGLSAQGREPFVMDRTESLIGKCYCWKRTRGAVYAGNGRCNQSTLFAAGLWLQVS